jgi:hypothetical protein
VKPKALTPTGYSTLKTSPRSLLPTRSKCINDNTVTRITVNLEIGKLTGRDDTMKIPNIPPFYSVSLAQVATCAARAFIGPLPPVNCINVVGLHTEIRIQNVVPLLQE